MDLGSRGKVEIFSVSTPKMGGSFAGSVISIAAGISAKYVFSCKAVTAVSAPEGVLHNYPVPFFDSMAQAGFLPHFLYTAQDFMTHDKWKILLNGRVFADIDPYIRRAYSTHLHAQKPVLFADFGNIKRLQRHFADISKNHGICFWSHGKFASPYLNSFQWFNWGEFSGHNPRLLQTTLPFPSRYLS
jgi:hypothetical protein